MIHATQAKRFRRMRVLLERGLAFAFGPECGEGLDFGGREGDPCVWLGSATARLDEPRAWTRCMMMQAAWAAIAVSLINRPAFSRWLSSGCSLCCFRVRKNWVILPESEGLHRWNFLGRMHEGISNEDKPIH